MHATRSVMAALSAMCALLAPVSILAVGMATPCTAAATISVGGDCDEAALSRTYLYRRLLPAQQVPDSAEVASFVFDALPGTPALRDTFPQIRLRASADLGLVDERLFVRFDGGPWESVYFPTEGDCSDPAECATLYPSDSLLLDGLLVVEILASPGVGAATCPEGFLEAALQFTAEQDRDCDGNRRDDACDILDGTLVDCNGNLWADSCELQRLPQLDCDGNGRPDCCDLQDGARDCNLNGVLDRCEITADKSRDCNGNGQLDACEVVFGGASDVDLNLIPDSCDIAAGRLADCDGNGVPDITEMISSNADADGDYLLDACRVVSPDLFPNGIVDSADLAVLLALWNTFEPLADFNRDGVVGAADLAVLLTAWGPVGVCGDGVADPGENCCNCPADVGCGSGFDCYYGECVACPSGYCPPVDDCEFLYGPVPPFQYATGDVCYGPDPQGFLCAYGLVGNTRAGGFSMNILCSQASRPTVALASLGFLALACLPRRRPRPSGKPLQR